MTKEKQMNTICEVCKITTQYYHKAKKTISKGLCANCKKAEKRGREEVIKKVEGWAERCLNSTTRYLPHKTYKNLMSFLNLKPKKIKVGE